MAIFLIVLSILALLGGFSTALVAKSAIHEIEAYILFLLSAVLFCGAAIVDVLKDILKIVKMKTGGAA